MSNKPFSTIEKKQLRRRTEEIVKNASGAKKVNEKPVGRAVPQPRQSNVVSPYSASKNGDVKSPPSRPTSAANSKPPTPWQRPKVTPASSNKEANKYRRPTSASAARRVNNSGPANSGTKPNNSNVSNTPGLKPSAINAKNRARAASSVANNNSSTPHPQTKDIPKENPRARSTSTPSTKEAKDAPAKKPVMHEKPKVNSNSAVSYKSGENVVLPKLEKSDATLETKKIADTAKSPNEDEKLLAPPRRSRAHVMPVSKTVKPLKKGHDFVPHELTDWVNWCDACGSIILSLFGKCVKCKKCMMVCHGKCASTVSLTCEADEIRAASQVDPTWYKTIVEETKDESTLKEYNTIHRVMPIGEIKERIEKFNKTVKSTQQMTLQEDGETFRGFIRVTMNLTRPVSVGGEEKEKDKKKLQRSASFYVNKGAVKALYLSSNTTAEEVVSALLNKYGIKDNPLKFALFEKQVREEGHIILRKMMTRERPLFLRLLWGDGSTQQHAFILQENESREIQWESFSLPELLTFLKILEKEQNDHITCIKVKFDSRRQDIVRAMDYQKKKGGK
ncbi:ras association domain-containing protein 5-like [Styela clava]